jgi:hypothetical protein
MIGSPSFESATSSHRETLAHLRILRTALAYLLGGPIPELDDPFGGKLSARMEEGRLRIWSIGRDGEDDGGRGSRRTRDQDIVMEVRDGRFR